MVNQSSQKDPFQLLDIVRDCKVSVLQATPTTFEVPQVSRTLLYTALSVSAPAFDNRPYLDLFKDNRITAQTYTYSDNLAILSKTHLDAFRHWLDWRYIYRFPGNSC